MTAYVTIAAKSRQYMLMAEILRPSLVLLRRSTSLSAKKRQRLPEAVGVEVDRHECLFEHDADRTGAAPVFAVQSGHFEPQRCRTPEEYKAWSQNLGHEHVLTTFCSHGDVSCYRQSEIMRSFASRGIGAAPQDRQVSGAGGNEIHTQRSRGKTLQGT